MDPLYAFLFLSCDNLSRDSFSYKESPEFISDTVEQKQNGLFATVHNDLDANVSIKVWRS
jgi:hypothetical protein